MGRSSHQGLFAPTKDVENRIAISFAASHLGFNEIK